MNLQKKLIQLSEYKCSFKYVDSYFLVSMTFPETWSIIPSEDRTIEVAEEGGVTFYAAPIETEIEKAFELIDDTIAYNLDVEKKITLLKYNITKLQELFGEKDLDELETIEFVTKPKKIEVKESTPKKPLKRRGRKPKTVSVPDPSEYDEPVANLIIETEKPMVLGDSKKMGFGGDNCIDEPQWEENSELEATNEALPTEQIKYLEEVDR